MEKFPVKVWKSTNMVDFPTSKIGNDGENLQKEIVFKFVDSFVDGQGRLEFKIGQRKNYIVLTKQNETYSTPIKNMITKEGRIYMQLVIDEKGEFKLTKDEEYKEKTEYYRKNNNIYTLLIAGTDYQIGDTIVGEIYIYTDIPTFKSNEFNVYCDGSINAVEEAPEGYEDWITHGNAKLNLMDEALAEMDNLDITAERVSDGVEISITDKEGQTTTRKVNDGEKGQKGDPGDDYVITPADYNSIANIVKQDIVIPDKTSDLTNDSGFITNVVNNLTNYYLKTQTYTKEEVNNIISQVAGVRLEKVNVLPQTGQSGVIYLVPNSEQEEQNIFNEYIWIDNNWELIGSTEIDLTGYATETWVSGQIADFLTESEINNLVSAALANYYTKGQVDSLLSNKADSSVLDNYVKFNDYATPTKAGVGRVNTNYGVAIADSTFATAPANTADIDGRNSTARNPMRNYRPIVPSIFDYTLKKSITTNNETLTESEKTSACGWLGTGKMVKLTQAEYDALQTKDSDTYYFIEEE